MEETGCEIICGAPTTLAVKGLMVVMMSIESYRQIEKGQDSQITIIQSTQNIVSNIE